MTISINGLGRMGRTILREALARGHKIVALNDVANWEILCYLIEFDSTHGHFTCDMKLELNTKDKSMKDKSVEHRGAEQKTQNHPPHTLAHTLVINGQKIRISNHEDSKDLDFGQVDVVIESSGKFLRSDEVNHHLDKGARRVIISAPPKDDTPTFVLGVNHSDYKGEKIISNASCTTNCIAPICYILDKHFGIESASMTTIHSYTNDQNLLDNAHRSDKRRSRAAATNIIPTTTGAALGLKRVLPSLRDKIHGQSVRVPIIDVSMSDLTFYLSQDFELDSVHEVLESYAKDSMKNILSIDDRRRVSSDFLGSKFSSIVAKDLSLKIGRMLKIMAWYDNESGYANRILDIAEYVCKKDIYRKDI